MMNLEGLTETRDCYCLAARREARAITRLYDEALRPVGLKSTQFSVLAALAQMKTSTLTPLADLLGVERTTLTRSTRLLEERGLLETVDTDDARERRLRLTPAGIAELEGALPLWRVVQRRLAGEGEPAAVNPAAS
ncbi:MAG TPA: MarR family transcriptional regulator [Trueperaceae bacterium]|nr:MarR family transcriptional regulator [Trueperaceae bacterium]